MLLALHCYARLFPWFVPIQRVTEKAAEYIEIGHVRKGEGIRDGSFGPSRDDRKWTNDFFFSALGPRNG